MNGKYCPACGSFSVVFEDLKIRCQTCGWREGRAGKPVLKKNPDAVGMSRLDDPAFRK